MTTLSKEDVVQLIEDLGAGSNWLSGNHNVYSYNRQPKIAAMFLKAFAEQGLLELIAELRKPHDWKLEGFGHFKDAKTSPSDAPFRAADALEHFVNSARADLVAENDRLKFALADTEALELGTAERLTATLTALAAAEADNERLREAIRKHKSQDWECNSDHPALNAALAQPRDDSALRRLLDEAKAGVYEECAKVIGNLIKECIRTDEGNVMRTAYLYAYGDIKRLALAEKAKEEAC